MHGVVDWERRHQLMRTHTALHVMSAVIKGNVTGGQVNADKSCTYFYCTSRLIEQSANAPKLV